MVESLEKDPMGVVDQHGRVFGVKGLRVVDASLFPIIPATNTATPVYGLSEVMSDYIKQDLACSKRKR